VRDPSCLGEGASPGAATPRAEYRCTSTNVPASMTNSHRPEPGYARRSARRQRRWCAAAPVASAEFVTRRVAAAITPVAQGCRSARVLPFEVGPRDRIGGQAGAPASRARRLLPGLGDRQGCDKRACTATAEPTRAACSDSFVPRSLRGVPSGDAWPSVAVWPSRQGDGGARSQGLACAPIDGYASGGYVYQYESTTVNPGIANRDRVVLGHSSPFPASYSS
jgi:hypothetical protein